MAGEGHGVKRAGVEKTIGRAVPAAGARCSVVARRTFREFACPAFAKATARDQSIALHFVLGLVTRRQLQQVNLLELSRED